MPVVRAAVILMAYPAGQSLNLKMDVHAYVQYFFNPDYGFKAYWLKQTDNDLLFDGAVFDWRVHTTPNPDLSNRTTVAKAAVDIMQSEHGVDFSPFDVIIVILGIKPSIPSDGGSTGVQSAHRSHHAIVARVGDPFDFIAHEIGHAFDLPHSFGSLLFQTAGEVPGGYAHPYCIMSAMSYGGLASPYAPTPPRNNWPEYSPLGPSLNAVTALGRGWIHAHSFVMPGSNTQELVLRSRHAGGRDLGRPPQAVEVRAANGDTFLVEYREDAADGWDRGQGAPLLIVAQGRGGTGEKAKPGKFSGTYLAKRSLPVVLGGSGHMYRGPGFGFVILDRSVLDHTVRIRLSPGNVPVPTVNAASSLTMDRSVVGQGITTWEPGEKFCYEGAWRYTKFAQHQTWTFEVTCNDAAPPFTAVWTVEGTVLTTSPQTVTVSKTVTVANASMNSVIVNQFVSIVCEVEPLPNGSRLRARDTPNHETYGFSVQVALSSSIGACTESFSRSSPGWSTTTGRPSSRRWPSAGRSSPT